jgi:hypothetical protein
MIEAMAYVNVWDSAYNESTQHYLPIHVHNQEIADGVHQAVCEELELDEDDWQHIQTIIPFKGLYVITFRSVVEENIIVYSVKFSY